MKKVIVSILAVFTIFTATAYCSSAIFLRITKNLQEKAEIVVLLSTAEDAYWKNFSNTLARDLDFSGYFKVEDSLFVQSPEESKKRYTTELILIGEETAQGISFRVEDLLDEKILFQKTYKRHENPSYFAHKVNNDIILHFTGRPGIALSKISFVSDATGKYQLYSVDYDGENLKQLTNAGHLVHFPRWLIPHKTLLYVSYEGGWAKLMKMDIESGETSMLIGEPGLNACASPNIKTGEIAVVLSKAGRPDIYIADFEGRIKRQITSGRSTDASPNFSPCGTMIAFVSDRHGSPQIYTMTRTGTRISRISFRYGYSTSPAWSPDGNYIAYVFMRAGSFGLAIYEIETRETRIIGEDLGSEDISWAPDSRHIVYSDIKSRPSSLVIIDIVTGEKRRLTPATSNSFSPSWSNFY